MPNWIQTNYVITGDSAEIGQLYDLLHELDDPVGEIYLSDIIKELGGDCAGIACRGYIAEYDLLDEYHLDIKTLTAYTPMHGVWDWVKSKLPSINYQYIEIE